MHDFCWVCFDPWSLHSHRTGGYFSCNRFMAQEKANATMEGFRGDMEAAKLQRTFSHTLRYSSITMIDTTIIYMHSLYIEMKLLQESTGKMRELERLGLALDKKAEFMIANLRGRGRSPEAKDGTVEASTVHGHEYYYSSL